MKTITLHHILQLTAPLDSSEYHEMIQIGRHKFKINIQDGPTGNSLLSAFHQNDYQWRTIVGLPEDIRKTVCTGVSRYRETRSERRACDRDELIVRACLLLDLDLADFTPRKFVKQ